MVDKIQVRRCTLIFFLFIVFSPAVLSAQSEPTVSTVNPSVGQSGDEVTISGDRFGGSYDSSKSSVKFKSNRCEKINNVNICKKVEYDAPIKNGEWTNNKIVILVPAIAEKEIFNIVVINDGKESKESTPFGGYPINLVERAIKMKELGVSESVIAEELYNLGDPLRKATPDTRGVFGNYRTTDQETVKMIQEGHLTDEFRSKLMGQKQYLNIGIAAIWLARTRDFTASPLIRIFLRPRPYFHENLTFFGDWPGTDFWGKLGNKFQDIVTRIDLNFGYTIVTSTTTNPEETADKKSYVLAGLSYEINRSAFFNFGWAGVPNGAGGPEDIKDQIYVGITIDENFLRDIKVLDRF